MCGFLQIVGVKTKNKRSSSQNMRDFWGEKQKIKGLYLKISANFHEFWGGTTKKKFFIEKICKKIVLADKVWGDNQYFRSLRPQIVLW